MQAMFEDDQPPGERGGRMDDAFLPLWERRWVRWSLGLGLALGLLGFFGARPGWRMFKAWRAGTMLAQARQLLDAGEVLASLDRSRAALRLVPDDPSGLRLMALGLGRTTSTRGALYHWQRYLKVATPSDDDRASLVDVAVREGLPEVAEPHVRHLLAGSNAPPRVFRLASAYYGALNRTKDALAMMRRAVEVEPGNPTNAFFLARLLETRTGTKDREEARTLYLGVAKGEAKELRWEACERLLVGPWEDREDRERVLALLGGAGLPTATERVLMAEARMQLDPSSARSIANETLQRLGNLTDAELIKVTSWLHRHDLYELSLPLLSPNRVRTQMTLFGLRIDALVEGGKGESAYRELLAVKECPDPLVMELWRYRAARWLKDDAAAERHRQQLLRVAGNDSGRLRRVAETAQQAGMRDLGGEAWKRLLSDRFERARALRSLAEIADAEGDTWAAREQYRRLVKEDPADHLAELRLLHYDLLLGENVEAAIKTAESRLTDPELEMTARYVAALGFLRMGNPSQARVVLGPAAATGKRLPAPHQVILTAVVGGSGETNTASRLAGSVPLAQLRPEEKELIRPYLLIGAPTR